MFVFLGQEVFAHTSRCLSGCFTSLEFIMRNDEMSDFRAIVEIAFGSHSFSFQAFPISTSHEARV